MWRQPEIDERCLNEDWHHLLKYVQSILSTFKGFRLLNTLTAGDEMGNGEDYRVVNLFVYDPAVIK